MFWTDIDRDSERRAEKECVGLPEKDESKLAFTLNTKNYRSN